MTAKKASGQGLPLPAIETATTTSTSGRKPWKKKSPVESMLAQIERLGNDVQKKEQELKEAKRQMQKLEEARKILESA